MNATPMLVIDVDSQICMHASHVIACLLACHDVSTACAVVTPLLAMLRRLLGLYGSDTHILS